MKIDFRPELAIKILIPVFFLVGLENITLPPIDVHDWRQTLTISIAQNFVEFPNIFYPRMDIGGQTNGVIASEFPIFNYLLSLLFKFFGTVNWYGRLLNWVISCAGLWFFYDIVRKSSSARVALFSTIALMGSVVFEYARKTMPDTFALFTTIAGVWFLWRYLESESRKHLIAGFFLVACGILSKIPFVVMLSFLIVPFLDNRYRFEAKRLVVMVVGIAMLLVGWWYFYWMPYLLETYGNQLIWPVSLQEGWKTVMEKNRDDTWRMLADIPFFKRYAFLLSVMGLGAIWIGADKQLKWLSLVYLPLILLFALKTGIVFATHEYYIIPLVPMMALCFGYFFDQFKWKNALTLGVVVLALMPSFIHFKERSFAPADSRAYLMGLPEIMDKYTQSTDKIMVNNGPFNPSMMYWAKRKGWSVNSDVPGRTDWMLDFTRQGLKYILIDRHLSDAPLPYTLLYEDPHFRLYRLDGPFY